MTSSTTNIRAIANFLGQSLPRHVGRTDSYAKETYDHFLGLWEICIQQANYDEDIPIELGNRICNLFDEWKAVLGV